MASLREDMEKMFGYYTMQLKNKGVTKDDIEKWIQDEKEAEVRYRKYGLQTFSRDEELHRKFFEELYREWDKW